MMHMRNLRRPTNAANNGKSFEHTLELIFRQYASAGVMRLKKVDPPTRTFGKGTIVHLENPFLDFVGAWTERGGRAVFIEAKSTSQKERKNLSFGDGGLREKQIAALQQWHAARAVSFVLWENHGECKLVTVPQITGTLGLKKRHLEWDNCFEVPKGIGFNIWDIIGRMEAIWP